MSSEVKKKLLWFGNIGDTSSFSRISKSFLNEAQHHYEITILAKKGITKIEGLNVKIVNLGDDTEHITYEEYLYMWKQTRQTNTNSLESDMKYAIVQMSDLIYKNKYDYVIICNGIYEASFLCSVIGLDKKKIMNFSEKQEKNTKLIVWTPIDYIPSYECVKDLFVADYLFTMTPIMSNILKKLKEKSENKNEVIIDWLGHGSDFSLKDSLDNRKKLIKQLNKGRTVWWNFEKDISSEDIIILNANNCVDRKRFDLTLLFFNKLLKSVSEDKKKILKLWIHTDIKKFNNYVLTNKLSKTIDSETIKHIIFSNNSISDENLALLYKIADYGLQTSTGEGWSLTNCEHCLYNPLCKQIVPDFLATNYHFNNGNYSEFGILMPVKLTPERTPNGHTVMVGVPDINIGCSKLIEDLSIKKTENKIKEIDSSWKNIFNSFQEKMI